MQRIKALSPLDGRYAETVECLRDTFSEFGLIKYRLFTEIEWLKFILKELKFKKITTEELDNINSIYKNFDIDDAMKIKKIEKTTKHDVKALEYYIKDQLVNLKLDCLKEWVHFACTSEDINNTAYAMMLRDGRKTISDHLSKLLIKIENFALVNKTIPMMSRTHGQPASPTTVGKEFINFAWRIKNEQKILENVDIQAKMNGATGNYNAHHFVFPNIDWIKRSKQFLSEYLALKPLIFTTQINPNHYISEMLHSLVRMASIIIDFNRDMWSYISIGYFKQKLKEGEIGSSTMPHKVNPINFENSEGNMGVAISLMEHISVKLQNSRYQRDLSDSTVLRNLGSIFGFLFLGINNSINGIEKIDLNHESLTEDLDSNLELLAEPIQTIMRMCGEANPYEKLKVLTRGQKITKKNLDDFIDSLSMVEDDTKNRMKKLTAHEYIGLAAQLVDAYFE